jgi:hypothetical protein
MNNKLDINIIRLSNPYSFAGVFVRNWISKGWWRKKAHYKTGASPLGQIPCGNGSNGA